MPLSVGVNSNTVYWDVAVKGVVPKETTVGVEAISRNSTSE